MCVCEALLVGEDATAAEGRVVLAVAVVVVVIVVVDTIVERSGIVVPLRRRFQLEALRKQVAEQEVP